MSKNYKESLNKSFNLSMGQKLYELVLPFIQSSMREEFNIFLIGSDIKNKQSLRAKIYNSLENNQNFNIFFPELIFEEQIFQQYHDLLTLENLLAESVDAVVMCVESPGSFTELGAFSNHEQLKNKLVVYLNSKYKKDKSFINLGPAKFLKKHTNSKVIHINPDEEFDIYKKKKLMQAIKSIKNQGSLLRYNLSNPLFAEKFLLALLYVFENLNKYEITEVFNHINSNSSLNNTDKGIPTSCLSILSQRGELIYNSNKKQYTLSAKGRIKLTEEYSNKFIHGKLDNIRVRVLNFKLRKLKMV
ncbi:retron St85 family effector protein [Bacillus solimangrovi]|uniref:Uncharacterized protein n=1 Tax=Bacillus solimangrovi TaxID=1305675 RepID=A0A1E5LER7_9BACI|nr:retron St85 family effector protein [Bacillus solimangrovi]OEH92566.1 hypothetical protein BFG57_15250 [Bacillus solimangrovi]